MGDKPRNLHQRIIAVMQQVKYVRKDVTVNAGAGGKYPGVSHDAVASILHGALADNGIVMRVTQDSSQTLEGQTKSGSPKIRYSGWYEVALINADDPQDRETYRVEAHAEDSGDKAPGKALSYAVKMILLKAFVLETGENDEARESPDEPILITVEQEARISELIEATGVDKAKFLAWLRVSALGEITAGRYSLAESELLKRLERAKEKANG